MSNVLLGWEWGGGLGHVESLVAVAMELEKSGHQCFIVAKDPAKVARLLPDRWHSRVMQAPAWPNRVSLPGFRATSFADILARRGYDDADLIAQVVAQWDQLLSDVNPQLVIANFAPTLNLAAHGRIDQVITGTGFTVPATDDGSFPPLDFIRTQPVVQSPTDQAVLLDKINQVQQRRSLPPIEQLTDFITSARPFVATLRELDPYQDQRITPADGPMQPWTPSRQIPEPDGLFYAYLDSALSASAELVSHLALAGKQGTVHLKNASDEVTQQLTASGLNMIAKPLDLQENLASYSLVIHHGGNGTAMAGLLAGRPQLLIPRFLEQDLTTRCLEPLGVAMAIRDQAAIAGAAQMADQLMQRSGVRQSCHDVRERIFARETFNVQDRMVEHCEQVLS